MKKWETPSELAQGGTGRTDVLRVANDGGKVGAGIWAQETVVRYVWGTKVGTDVGIGASVLDR